MALNSWLARADQIHGWLFPGEPEYLWELAAYQFIENARRFEFIDWVIPIAAPSEWVRPL